MIYYFTVVLATTDYNKVKNLVEASPALKGVRVHDMPGKIGLGFDRKGPSQAEAIHAALHDVRNAGLEVSSKDEPLIGAWRDY